MIRIADSITPEVWKKFKRITGIILGAFIWWAGFSFSRSGFERFLDLPAGHWLGILLGISVTWLQLNLNEGLREHPTLFYSGIGSYIYGFFTNWYGLFAFQTAFFSAGLYEAFLNSPFECLMRIGLTIVVGIGFDLVPEPMITFGLFGRAHSSDLLRSLAQGVNFSWKNNRKNVTFFPDSANITSNFEPVRNFEHENDKNKRTNKQTNNPFVSLNWESIPGVQRKILSFAKRHFDRTGQIPGPTLVSKRLYNTTSKKGYVSQTYKDFDIAI